MQITPKQLIDDVKGIVSLPSVCVHINEMVDDPNSSLVNIGKVVAQDPALTLRILKIANSPFYGLSNEIETVGRAVAILGTTQLRDMVLATAATRIFDGIPNNLITMKLFWRHSIACGIAARMLADQVMPGKGESLFVAGLLHDIGQLVMFNKLPEESKQILLYAFEEVGDGDVFSAEMHHLGFTHCDVGAELVREWRLPPLYQECIEFHHSPEKATQFPQEVALIHIAQATANLEEAGTVDEEKMADISDNAWEITGFTKEDIPPVIKAIRLQISEVMTTFLD